MKKRAVEKELWETPSLEWIHRVRRERQVERAGRPLRPLSYKKAEKLAKKYGLELASRLPVGR